MMDSDAQVIRASATQLRNPASDPPSWTDGLTRDVSCDSKRSALRFIADRAARCRA